MNDWRGSCEIKMNNLEFSRFLTNLKIVSGIRFHPNKVLLTCFSFTPLSDFRGGNVLLRFLSVGKDNLKLTKACRLG